MSNPWRTIYWPTWEFGYGDANCYPAIANVDFSAMTHLILFDEGFNTSGVLSTPKAPISDYINPTGAGLIIPKAHAAGVKVLAGFGGENSDSNFKGATSSTSLPVFVSNIVAYLKANNFDGIDVDWEQLSDSMADKAQFIAFIQALRTALPAPWIITAAFPSAGAAKLAAQVAQYLDQINLMQYDLLGPWGGWPIFHSSPIYPYGPNGTQANDINQDKAAPTVSGDGKPPSGDNLLSYVNAGVPIGKIGISDKFDGTVWQGGSFSDGRGVLRPTTYGPPAPSPANGEYYITPPTTSSVPLYNRDGKSGIMQKYGANPVKWDSDACASWMSIQGASPAQDTFISFLTADAINAKAAYIASKGLGGLMLYDFGAGADPSTNSVPLLSTIKSAFSGTVTPPPVTQYTVTVQGTTGGTVSGGGIFNSGASDTIVATPASGYKFVNWTDTNGNVVSTSTSYAFNVTTNITYTANFAAIVVTPPPPVVNPDDTWWSGLTAIQKADIHQALDLLYKLIADQIMP